MDRFWAKILRAGPDECWEWQAARNKDDYGIFQLNGKATKAHRVAFGDLSVPVVRHSCDNPPCCNPAHLLPGTDLDNIADRVARGRSAKGSKNGAVLRPETLRPCRGELSGTARLTAEQVSAIRAAYVPGVVSQRELAEQFQTTQSHISRILNRRNWRDS